MTEEEKQELETLRKEKRQQAQQARAQAALEAACVPVAFAPLLAGADDADTDKKTEQFCNAYQAALEEDIRKRLPTQPPVVTPAVPQKPKRGIQRLR